MAFLCILNEKCLFNRKVYGRWHVWFHPNEIINDRSFRKEAWWGQRLIAFFKIMLVMLGGSSNWKEKKRLKRPIVVL